MCHNTIRHKSQENDLVADVSIVYLGDGYTEQLKTR